MAASNARRRVQGMRLMKMGWIVGSASVYYRGAHKSNPYMSEKILRDAPDRERILSGEKRFDAESARALYQTLDFLPYSINGYVGCMCGKACDRACYEHLERSGLLCRAKA